MSICVLCYVMRFLFDFLRAFCYVIGVSRVRVRRRSLLDFNVLMLRWTEEFYYDFFNCGKFI